ncbi:MAG: acetylxylan esterase [Bryobacterales bacterium]|nr:acetylxylan esterase [Bryobacterales bacterium]
MVSMLFFALTLQPAAPVVDGFPEGAFWRASKEIRLTPRQAGVPPSMGGSVRLAGYGRYSCVLAQLPEAGGRISARSFGRNPIWEKDAMESPEVEDRIEFSFESEADKTTVAINPWGAYRVDGDPAGDVLAAARINRDGWRVESCVPLNPGKLRVRAIRIRARRPLAPEFQWSAESEVVLAAGSAGSQAPVLQPPVLGNRDAPLEVGRVAQLPAVVAKWEDPAWRKVPAFQLPRNEAYPRAPRYSTNVKWMHDGKKLGLLLRLEEPEPVVARAGGRDSATAGDDHFAIYLATSGSAIIEIRINSVGAIYDARIAGPRRMNSQSGWNADIEVQTDIRHGAWYARMDLPLQQLAAALGETGVPPEWRILLARHRARRSGEAAEVSALPALGTSAFRGPLRYRAMILRDAPPDAVAKIGNAWKELPSTGLAHELAQLDSRVWSALERRNPAVTRMVEAQQRKRAQEAIRAERQEWEEVRTRQDWERFRDPRIAALRESVGQFPPQRPPLDVRVSGRYSGKGYRLENLVYQSRPGYYVTANLYLPERAAARMPGMIIVHSQHFPKTQGELHDMGELWARTGCAVLIIERPGYGERAETNTWYRQAYGSRFTFSKQLFLIGESYSGWVAWDIIRAVDVLNDRPDIDRDRIILLGSVAGGGEPAAVAAALDPRIAAVVPFNYDQGHIRVHGDSPGQIAKQFSPWLVAASVAPRRFVRAFEFGWEGAEEPDYPELWVDGMLRSQKVWGFYGARENLAASQAYGLIRLSMERVSHCFSIGPQQRVELYPIFKRWFDIPLPSEEDLSILPDSRLSTNPHREAARRQEALRRRPHAELMSITPELSAQLKRRPMHELAHEMGLKYLQAARARRQPLAPEQRRQKLREELQPLLGDITPGSVQGTRKWTRSLSGAEVEALVLDVEPGIQVPLLMLGPGTGKRAPVVVAVAQAGKERFLVSRAEELERLVRAGVRICLPDLRGTGETSPSNDRNRDGGVHFDLAQMEFDLAQNLAGARLKDLRTVLAYLRTRTDVDSNAISVWGDSFVPPNSAGLYLDEIEQEVSPEIQYRSEPLGALLALLAVLYEDGVKAAAARGGIASYLTMLGSAFTYTPMDAVLLGVLKVGDIADIVAAAAPKPVLFEAAVDGRNVIVDAGTMGRMFPAERSLTVRPERGDVAAWLIAQTKP